MTFIKTFEERLDEAQFAYSLGEWISSSFATNALAEERLNRNKATWFTQQDAEPQRNYTSDLETLTTKKMNTLQR